MEEIGLQYSMTTWVFLIFKLFFKDGYCVAQTMNDGAVGLVMASLKLPLAKTPQIQIAFVSVSCSFWEDGWKFRLIFSIPVKIVFNPFDIFHVRNRQCR